MTVTTNEFGQQNIFKEPEMVVESYNRKGLGLLAIRDLSSLKVMMGIISGFSPNPITGNSSLVSSDDWTLFTTSVTFSYFWVIV